MLIFNNGQAHSTVTSLTKRPRRFVVPIIPPNYHYHDLELSGSCQSNKSEFLLNQSSQSAPFQLHSQVWNDDPRAVSSIAASNPPWWTEFINDELFSNEAHQRLQNVSASVYETSHANQALSSIPAVFEPTFQLPGLSHQSVDFNVPANFATDFDPQAFQAYPDSTNSMNFQNSIPLPQPDWNSTESSPTPEFDCDTYSMASGVFTPPENQTVRQESQENPKCQISLPRASKCPHCSKPFFSERLEYVL